MCWKASCCDVLVVIETQRGHRWKFASTLHRTKSVEPSFQLSKCIKVKICINRLRHTFVWEAASVLGKFHKHLWKRRSAFKFGLQATDRINWPHLDIHVAKIIKWVWSTVPASNICKLQVLRTLTIEYWLSQSLVQQYKIEYWLFNTVYVNMNGAVQVQELMCQEKSTLCKCVCVCPLCMSMVCNTVLH